MCNIAGMAAIFFLLHIRQKFLPTMETGLLRSRPAPWLLSVDFEPNELKQEIPIIQNKKYTAECKTNVILNPLLYTFMFRAAEGL